MSNNTGLSTERFARDMRRLRIDRGITVETVHSRTQVAVPLIRTFEDGGLHNHETFNEVYLRSFVRAYARAIELSPDVALKALDAALAGAYQAELATQYLAEAEGDRPTQERDGEESDDEGQPAARSSEDAVAPPSSERPSAPEGGGDGPAPAFNGDIDDADTNASQEQASEERASQAPSSQKQASNPTRATPSQPAEASSHGATTANLPGAKGDSEPTSKSERNQNMSPRLASEVQVLLGGGVAVLVLLGVGLFYLLGGTSGSSEPNAPALDRSLRGTSAARSSTASTTAEPSETPSRRRSPTLTVGETIHLSMRADSNVSRILVRRDDDLRRPYWIRQGEVEVFPFQDRIRIERGLDDVSLFLEGFPYPVRPDGQGYVTITRSQVRAFADTLRGAPVTWNAAPDTNRIGPPSSAPIPDSS